MADQWTGWVERRGSGRRATVKWTRDTNNYGSIGKTSLIRQRTNEQMAPGREGFVTSALSQAGEYEN